MWHTVLCPVHSTQAARTLGCASTEGGDGSALSVSGRGSKEELAEEDGFGAVENASGSKPSAVSLPKSYMQPPLTMTLQLRGKRA